MSEIKRFGRNIINKVKVSVTFKLPFINVTLAPSIICNLIRGCFFIFHSLL